MKPKFSGHETFPLRYGWLHKSVNLLINKESQPANSDEVVRDAIVNLGVGRNMVNSIRYWSEMSGVLELRSHDGRSVTDITKLGRFLFDHNSGSQSCVDPFLEKIGSIWLLHFELNFESRALTSYRYFFNYCNYQSFEKNKLVDEIFSSTPSLTGASAGKRATVKKDVDCFLHTYTKKARSSKIVDEEYFSSPLSELGLVREVSSGFMVSELSERRSLPTEIFSYALCRFIARETTESNVNSIDFDSILSKPGSPGRIFRMSEQGLTSALDSASKLSYGKISWTDSLGLRQIMITDTLKNEPEEFLELYYGGGCAFF